MEKRQSRFQRLIPYIRSGDRAGFLAQMQVDLETDFRSTVETIATTHDENGVRLTESLEEQLKPTADGKVLNGFIHNLITLKRAHILRVGVDSIRIYRQKPLNPETLTYESVKQVEEYGIVSAILKNYDPETGNPLFEELGTRIEKQPDDTCGLDGLYRGIHYLMQNHIVLPGVEVFARNRQ